jgi:hypothetical protein
MLMNVTPAAIILVLLAGRVAADEIQVGDSREQVVAALGAPQGVMKLGGTEILTYERGTIELEQDRVTTFSLLTPEQLTDRRAEAARQAEAARIASEQRRVEGTALRDQKVADAVFMASPAAERLAYWEWFRRTYPEVSVEGEYQSAKAQADEVRRIEEARTRNVAELEARVDAAERRAREAEAEADDHPAYYVPAYYSDYGGHGYPRPSVGRPGHETRPVPKQLPDHRVPPPGRGR